MRMLKRLVPITVAAFAMVMLLAVPVSATIIIEPPPIPPPLPPEPPPGGIVDTVAITRAEFAANNLELRVEATSTNVVATLTVWVTATGEFLGTLPGDGPGRFKARFLLPVNPQIITVKSIIGGSDTAAIILK